MQKHVAMIVGISEARVSQLHAEGVFAEGSTLGDWVAAYCDRLREQAAGRFTDGPLDLAQERAALARAQREGVDLKNALLRGQYAAVSLLAEVLATASQAVAERFEHLPGLLRKACPDLPAAAIDQVLVVIANARNEWVRQTSALVSAAVMSADDEPELDGLSAGDDHEPRAD